MPILTPGGETASYYDPKLVGRNPIREVLKLLCKKAPPKFVKGYSTRCNTDEETEALQVWCLNNAGVYWLTGIGIQDAADLLVAEAVSNANIPPESYWTGIEEEDPPERPITALYQFQGVVREWTFDTFGAEAATNSHERGMRLLEESLELIQAIGIPKEKASLLLDYVYGRPPGEVRQEVSGVLITALSAASCFDIDAAECLREELERICDHEVQDKCRSKQKAKSLAGVAIYNGQDMLGDETPVEVRLQEWGFHPTTAEVPTCLNEKNSSTDAHSCEE